ncbi:MAG: MerR family transcriptional regulator [Moorella sp. (in: Bacteria)]|nr:MerR family transcriptional regulator [Moorella sp. (in: firmicutes)]
MTVKLGYRTSEVAKLTGLTKRQLDHWDRTGLFRPSLAQAEGRGSARFYSFSDVVQLRVAKELRDAGVSLQGLRKVVAYLRKAADLEHPLAGTRLVVSGSDVLLVEGQNDLVSILNTPGQGVLRLVLDLPRVVDDLSQKVKSLEKGDFQYPAGNMRLA